MAEMADRQYEASMAKNLTVLNNFPNSIADQALFQMGLLYAHPENPNQNYQKSLGAFNKILNEYSESHLRHQAQIWVLIIEDVIDKKQKIGILNKKKVSLARTVEQQRFARCRAGDCHPDAGIAVSVPHPPEKLAAGTPYTQGHQAARLALNGKHPPAGRHGWRGHDRAPVAWP